VTPSSANSATVNNRQAEPVEQAGLIKIRATERRVIHVEVFWVGGVRISTTIRRRW